MKGLESVQQTLRAWASSASETLAIILNQGVYPAAAEVEVVRAEAFEGWQGVSFPLALSGEVEGQVQVLLEQPSAHTLLELLVGGQEADGQENLTPLHQTALKEAVQQLVPSLAELLKQLGSEVKVRSLGCSQELSLEPAAGEFLHWKCPLEVDEGPRLIFELLLSGGLVAQLGAPRPQPKPAAEVSTAATHTVEHGAAAERPHFPVLTSTQARARNEQLDLILDVNLQVQVVLGRTSMMVQDLIHLGEGSILELDKLAGEPVELFVQDRLVAFGEVVVIDERFGVKVLELAGGRRTSR